MDFILFPALLFGSEGRYHFENIEVKIEDTGTHEIAKKILGFSGFYFDSFIHELGHCSFGQWAYQKPGRMILHTNGCAYAGMPYEKQPISVFQDVMISFGGPLFDVLNSNFKAHCIHQVQKWAKKRNLNGRIFNVFIAFLKMQSLIMPLLTSCGPIDTFYNLVRGKELGNFYDFDKIYEKGGLVALIPCTLVYCGLMYISVRRLTNLAK